MNIRLFTPQDESETLNLFSLVFGKSITQEYWRWLDSNPSGPMIRTVMDAGGDLAGFYSLMPLKLQSREGLITSALSVGTMTHPGYRKQGIFTSLARETYHIAKEMGIRFICGFPNSNSYPGFVNKLSWFHICDMPLLSLTASRMKNQATGCLTVKQVREFDKRVDDFIESNVCSNDCLTHTLKNSGYLNWRYDTIHIYEDTPPREYIKYIIERDGTVRGYMVLKHYVNGDNRTVHIVDIATGTGERDVFNSFVSAAMDHASSIDANTISCWMLDHTPYWKMLVDQGFQVCQGGNQPFAGLINTDPASMEFIKNRDNWFITMGDSDVF